MALNLGRRGPVFHKTIGLIKRSKRAHRLFRPQRVAGLERRALLSAFATSVAEAHPLLASAQAHGTHSLSTPSWTESQNISFPTVNGQSELLDVYMPDSPAPIGGYPVMVAIHGGGWRSSDKSNFGLRTALGFTPHGYAVVAPDYELSASGHPTWPANLEDVQAAVRWVRNNAGSMNFNPNEIVAEGESAGANLAALVGVYSPRSRDDGVSSAVAAVVAVSTPANLTALYHEKRYAGTAAAEFLGGSPRQVAANYIAASPIDHVAPDDPPMLLIHGRQDPVIPLSQSEHMQATLTAAGVRNELLVVNGGHGLDFPAHYSNLIADVLEFLYATWKD
jgi:acetyl esterase/lipase